jgi:hypothetical protein
VKKLNINTEQRSNIRRFGKIALFGLIFGAALALMFALTALAEDGSETTETTVTTIPDTTTTTEPDVTTTTIPDITTTTVTDTESVVDETTASGEEPVVDETTTTTIPDITTTTVTDTEPVVDETTASGEEPSVVDDTTIPEEPVEENADVNSEVPAGPVVTTDKAEYDPGDQVNMSGSGFQPGESVEVSFMTADNTVETTIVVTADENGNILVGYTILGSDSYTVSATGISSGLIANTSFLDCNFNVSGYKYVDVNGNGTYDSGTDVPKPGWTIYLTKSGGGGWTHSTTTGADGKFSFINQGAGSYTVSEDESNTDWIKTFATGTLSFIRGWYDWHYYGDADVTNIKFGNFQLFDVSGYKYVDVNGNSAYDAGDTPKAGWTIKLTKNGAAQPNATTDGTGKFTFVNLGPGAYVVSEDETVPDWVKTYQSGTLSFTASSGVDVTNIKFGNFQYAKICGYKINDLNGDGILDLSEPGLPDWTITLIGTDSLGIPVDLSATTDANGRYCFEGLWASDENGYTIAEVPQTDWVQTYPLPIPPGNYVVIVTSGFGSWWDCDGVDGQTERSTLDFGNVYVPPSITTDGGPTPSLEIAGITTEKHKVAGIQVAGITELPFTGSNMLVVYAIAILMIISGTAILSTTKKTRKNRA